MAVRFPRTNSASTKLSLVLWKSTIVYGNWNKIIEMTFSDRQPTDRGSLQGFDVYVPQLIITFLFLRMRYVLYWFLYLCIIVYTTICPRKIFADIGFTRKIHVNAWEDIIIIALKFLVLKFFVFVKFFRRQMICQQSLDMDRRLYLYYGLSVCRSAEREWTCNLRLSISLPK